MHHTIQQNLPSGYKLIYLTEFGSSLYGTSSSKSDKDFKGLFIPSLEDVVLKRDKEHFDFSSNKSNNKNSNTDVDVELWSVQKFFHNLKRGETGALDVLFSMFSPSVQFETERSNLIKSNYNYLVSKNSKAFVGYCMQQASKYGIKGSRYGDLLTVAEFLEDKDDTLTISDVIQNIPVLDYISTINKEGLNYVSILGKLHQDNVSLGEFKKRVSQELNKYGKRTQKALVDGGVDWKALSHAFRVIFELRELTQSGKVTFPLLEADVVKEVKYNKTVESLDDVVEQLRVLLDETTELLKLSSLPDEVDFEKVDNLLLSFYGLKTLF